MSPEWLTVIITSILALTAVITVCRDIIIGFFYYPELNILAKPFIHRVPFRLFHEKTGKLIAVADADFIRIEIDNNGKTSAKDVEVLVTEVRGKQDDGSYKPLPLATPYSLSWAHRLDPSLAIFHPKSKKHITLGYITDPDERHNFTYDDNPDILIDPKKLTLFTIAFTIKSSNREYLLPPGEYEFEIQAVASNLKKPVEAKVYLNHKGEWFEIDSEMYSKGIEIKIYPV